MHALPSRTGFLFHRNPTSIVSAVVSIVAATSLIAGCCAHQSNCPGSDRNQPCPEPASQRSTDTDSSLGRDTTHTLMHDMIRP